MKRLLLLACALWITASPPASAATGGPDADGYRWKDSLESDGPAYQWIEIHSTGRKVISGGDDVSSRAAPPLGIGEPVKLDVPWHYRGEVIREIVPSSNGYLSTAWGDTGADATPDCPLPAVPSHTTDPAEDARIYVYHADLEHSNSGFAGVYYQYFHRSPHSHHPGGVHVFQWHLMKRKTHQATFTFQVLLFDTGDILMQYQDASPVAGGYTIGAQNHDSTTALTYSCGGSRSISAGRAVLFEPAIYWVTSLVDVPAGGQTLRQAWNSHVQYPDATARRDVSLKVKFLPALNGQTITLTQGPLLWEGIVVIDASNLPDGITISGNGQHTIFERKLGVADSNGVHGWAAIRYFHGTRLNFTATPRVFNMNMDRLAMYTYYPEFFSYRTLLLNECGFRDIEAEAEEPHLPGFAGYNRRDLSPSLAMLNPAGWVAWRDCTVENSRMRHAVNLDDGNGVSGIPAAPGRALTFLGCEFRDNTAPAADTAHPTLVRCGYFTHPFTPLLLPEFTIDGSTFKGNAHSVLNLETAGTRQRLIRNSTFHGNTRTPVILKGGPTGNETLAIEGCTFSENEGGALSIDRMRATVVNSTFSGNSGGAFSALRVGPTSGVFPSELRIAHSTFSGNSSSGDGAAVLMESGACLVENTIVHDSSNTEPGISPNFATAGSGSFQLFHGGILVHPADAVWGFISTSDPLLGALEKNGGPTATHAPLSGSPALDAGDTVNPIVPLPATDQRGEPRVQDSDGNGTANLSIGAVESAIPLIVTTAVDETNNPATLSLREAVAQLGTGGRITFAPSLNGATITLGSTLLINVPAEIDASNLAAGITIQRTGGAALRMNQAHTLILRKISFQKSNPAILLENGAGLTLQSCRIAECISTEAGAGLRAYGGGRVAILDTNFVFNEATGHGGAIYYQGNGELILRRALIAGNRSGADGGGIFTGAGTLLTVERSSIVRNVAQGAGGGISTGGSAQFERATIGDNRALSGIGAVALTTGSLSMNHCTVMRNRGTTSGHHAYPGSHYDHCIIAENRITTGISNGNFSQSTGDYNLSDTLLMDHEFTGPNSRSGIPVRLSPLGWHGGPIPTYTPLTHSPAIDAGHPADGVLQRDGRGFLFRKDGNGDGITRSDIGAVEAFKPVVVTTTADQFHTPSGPQVSLREAIRDCPPGGRITFAPSLSNATCTLGALGALSVNGKAVTIDATSLPRGVKVSTSGTARLFNVTASGSLSMHAVSLTGADTTVDGGAVVNNGRLTLSRAAIYGNVSSSSGGGIYHQGVDLILDHCTFANNHSLAAGSALRAAGGGPVMLSHCTFQGNSSSLGSAVHFPAGTRLEMTHTALGGNIRGGSVPDNFTAAGIFTSWGWNASDTVQPQFTGTGDLQNQPLGLQKLDDLGGYSLVCDLASGSVLINAGSPSFTTGVRGEDQRGARRIMGAAIDIGALESSALIDTDGDGLYDWWELVYQFNPNLPGEQHQDADGDGIDNLAEFLAGTNPRDFTGTPPPLEIVSVEILDPAAPASDVELVFTSGAGLVYEIEWSEDLADWFPWTSVTGAAGGGLTTVLLAGGYEAEEPRRFFRIIRH